MADAPGDLVMSLAARQNFSGAVQVANAQSILLSEAFGAADRAAGIRNTIETRFGIASGTKLVTALAAGALIDDGVLAFDDRLVDVVSAPLPGISAAVTIGHLLTHTSGVYDYLDEDVVTDAEQFQLPIPPSSLLTPRDYLPMLVAGPAKFEPGARFSYSNGGYVLLGIALEEVARASFHALVEERVLGPCGMTASGFFRFDRLPAHVSTGYLETGRTNVGVLPIVGGPDGGMFATTQDIDRLWRGFLGGRILFPETTSIFLEKATATSTPQSYYGRGHWIHDDGTRTVRFIVGQDAGVSFRSNAYADGTIATVVSNSSKGAWPMIRAIDDWIRSRA